MSVIRRCTHFDGTRYTPRPLDRLDNVRKAPQHSRVPGVAAYARATGAEVVLNGNTLEGGVDQYISMVQVKAIAGPGARDERLPSMALSSESRGYWLFPFTAPTFRLGEVSFGELKRSAAMARAA